MNGSVEDQTNLLLGPNGLSYRDKALLKYSKISPYTIFQFWEPGLSDKMKHHSLTQATCERVTNDRTSFASLNISSFKISV